MGKRQPVDREIVGVAEDIRIGGLYEPPEMYVYVPYAQDTQSFGLLLVESYGDSAAIVGAVKRLIAEIDPALPVLNVSSIAAHMQLLLYEERRNSWIALAIACLAMTLGAVGVHGVVSLVTARRTKEIGIRVVLGAGRAELLRLLLGRGVGLAAAGAAFGHRRRRRGRPAAQKPTARAGSSRSLELHGSARSSAWGSRLQRTSCPHGGLRGRDPAVALRDE